MEEIKKEIIKFPLTVEQKEYIVTALNFAYELGKSQGIENTGIMIKNSEVEDQEVIE